MTEVELRQKERELANQEEELQGYAREILERERALQAAEKSARRADVERTDYLFDAINANRKLTIEIPAPVQISQPRQTNFEPWIVVMSTLAAAFSIGSVIVALL